MVRPSAWATLRLITSSNLVGLLDGQIGRLGAFEELVDVVLRRRRDEALRGARCGHLTKAHPMEAAAMPHNTE